MSIYLGNIGRKIVNFSLKRPRLQRAVDAFGSIAHKATLGRYTPGLTREAFRLFQKTLPGDRIEVRAEGFYRNGERVAGNEYISGRIIKNGVTAKFQRTEEDSPENISKYCRSNFRSASRPRTSRREFVTNLGCFMGLAGLSSFFSVWGIPRLFKGLKELKTPSANFYGWFAPHVESRTGAMPLDAISEIARNEEHLIIVPERIDDMLGIWPEKEILRKVGSLSDYPLLSGDASRYVLGNKLPVFFADLFVSIGKGGEYDLEKMEHNMYSPFLHLAQYAGTAIIASAVSAGTKYLSRRTFFANIFGGAIACGVPLANPAWLVDTLMDGNRWTVDFRNAVIAIKILQLTKHAQINGIKPSFLLLMGYDHRGIMDNLAKGIDYNMGILNDFIGAALSRYGEYWDKGYLVDETKSLQMGEYLEVPISGQGIGGFCSPAESIERDLDEMIKQLKEMEKTQ